jgi:hypothetical protein
MLQSKVDYINDVNGKPREPYTRNEAGQYIPNVGTFFLEGAFGGNRVVLMTANGIDSRPIGTGYVSKKELYAALCNFANGLDYGKGRL